RASIVGLSCWMNDSNVDAPMRSPAAANTVFGFSARNCWTAPARTAAPAFGGSLRMRPWKSFVPSTWMVIGTSCACAGLPATLVTVPAERARNASPARNVRLPRCVTTLKSSDPERGLLRREGTTAARTSWTPDRALGDSHQPGDGPPRAAAPRARSLPRLPGGALPHQLVQALHLCVVQRRRLAAEPPHDVVNREDGDIGALLTDRKRLDANEHDRRPNRHLEPMLVECGAHDLGLVT